MITIIGWVVSTSSINKLHNIIQICNCLFLSKFSVWYEVMHSHIHKDHNKKKKKVNQKQFLLDMIRVLIKNAHKHKKLEELLTPTKNSSIL